MTQSPESPPRTESRSRLRIRYGRSGIALLGVIALIGLAAGIHALTGENPWGREVAKRIAQDLPFRSKEYGIIGVWWGCVVAAVISLFLLATARLWLPGRNVGMKRAPFTPPGLSGFALTVLTVILVGAAVYRVPRLDQSLWNDEEYGLRRHAHGEWKHAKSGELVFEPVSWTETLFECRVGNNHHLNSALGRVSLSGWHFFTGAPPEEFSESAFRAPALAAGILTLALLVILGSELGLPWVGVGAAGLLALHPWHVRYSVEARGYSLMMFFMCLMLVALTRAFRTNRVAAWTLFAIAEAGCLLSFAGSLYPVAMINAFALLECLIRREPKRIGTLIGFNLLGSIPVIVWLLPSVPQVLAYLKRPDALRLGMDWDWGRDCLSHLLSGAHYYLPELEIHHGTSWLQQAGSHPLFVPVLCYLLPFLSVAGLLLALFRNTASRLCIGGIAVGGVAAFVHNAAQNSPMVVWYLLYVLIPIALAAPLACLRIIPMRSRLGIPALIALLAAFGVATQDVRGRIVAYDRQPMRQTVASIREAKPEAMTAVFGVSDRQTQSYDPKVRVMESAADLDRVIADAHQEGRPLFVYFCGRVISGERNADLMKRVLDPTEFKHVSDHPGLEAMFTYHVYQLIKKAPAGASAELPQN
jgi:hypothetical protein